METARLKQLIRNPAFWAAVTSATTVIIAIIGGLTFIFSIVLAPDFSKPEPQVGTIQIGEFSAPLIRITPTPFVVTVPQQFRSTCRVVAPEVNSTPAPTSTPKFNVAPVVVFTPVRTQITANAPAALKDRMPYVTDGPDGPKWVSRGGAEFGLQNGMGSAGRKYVPGQIHRSDRMAATGLYDDGKKGIRRLTDPELRLADQDRDGVQAEVLYGIAGRTMRLRDPEAAAEMMRIYNQWLADFCDTHPDRFAGLAAIPNHDVGAPVAEIQRVVKRGGFRALAVTNPHPLPRI